MTASTTERVCRATLNRTATWLLIATAAVAIAIAGLAVSTLTASAAQPVAGATYEGPVGETTDCGGGTVSVTVGPGGADVAAAAYSDFNLLGQSLSDSATFGPGAVPIVDGSFTANFPVFEGPMIRVSGVFDGGQLSGTVSFLGSTCLDLPFAAQVAGGLATPTAVIVTPTTAAAALPPTGSEPGGSASPVLWALTAAIGFAALTIGYALLRRRGA